MKKYNYIICVLLILSLLLGAALIVTIVNPKTVVKEIVKEVPVELIKEIEVIEEVEVVKEVIVEIEPTPAIEMSSSDRELLSRLVYREGGSTTFDCQAGIASVVINRLRNGTWGATIHDVIFSPSQFYVAPLMQSTTPNDFTYEAVDSVLDNDVTLPDYVMYFNLGDPLWRDGYHDYVIIDGVHFGYYEKDIKEG